MSSGERDGQPVDSGLICLVLLANHHQVPAEPGQLRHHFGRAGESFTDTDILRAAKSLHLKAKCITGRWETLMELPLPVIAKNNNDEYFLILRTNKDRILLQDTRKQSPDESTRSDLEENWTGELILITKRAGILNEIKQFDFSWFIPAILKYKKLLGEVLLTIAAFSFVRHEAKQRDATGSCLSSDRLRNSATSFMVAASPHRCIACPHRFARPRMRPVMPGSGQEFTASRDERHGGLVRHELQYRETAPLCTKPRRFVTGQEFSRSLTAGAGDHVDRLAGRVDQLQIVGVAGEMEVDAEPLEVRQEFLRQPVIRRVLHRQSAHVMVSGDDTPVRRPRAAHHVGQRCRPAAVLAPVDRGNVR